VQILPKYLDSSNVSDYILPAFLTGYPGVETGSSMSNNDLNFTWSNDPSFQFEVSRSSSGEVIFSTFGKKIVFEDQFLELATSMVPNYNVYGLPEVIHQFRLGNNLTRTFWAADAGNNIDV